MADSELSGHVRFQLGRRDQLVLFKQRDEPTSHLVLKAIAYALFFRHKVNLQVSPRLDYKVQPDLAALDLRGEPEVWIQCAPGNLDKIEYVCKHVPARQIVLVTEEDSTEELVARLRKRIHYKHTARKLKLVNFRPPVESWLDPDHLDVPEGTYDVVEF